MTARPLPAAAPAPIGTRAAAFAAVLLIAGAVGAACAGIAVAASRAAGSRADGILVLVFVLGAGAALAGMVVGVVVAAAVPAAGGPIGRRALAIPAEAVEKTGNTPLSAVAPASASAFLLGSRRSVPETAPSYLPAPAPTPAPATVAIPQLVGAMAGPAASAGTSPWASPAPAPASAPPAERLAVPADAPMLAVLTWDDGARMAVYGRTLYGRNPAPEPGTASIPVRDETLSLSKTHFEIGGDATGTWIADRHSTNGTVLVRDGGRHPLVAGLPTALRPGDRLELGDRSADVGLAS